MAATLASRIVAAITAQYPLVAREMNPGALVYYVQRETEPLERENASLHQTVAEQRAFISRLGGKAEWCVDPAENVYELRLHVAADAVRFAKCDVIDSTLLDARDQFTAYFEAKGLL